MTVAPNPLNKQVSEEFNYAASKNTVELLYTRSRESQGYIVAVTFSEISDVYHFTKVLRNSNHAAGEDGYTAEQVISIINEARGSFKSIDIEQVVEKKLFSSEHRRPMNAFGYLSHTEFDKGGDIEKVGFINQDTGNKLVSRNKEEAVDITMAYRKSEALVHGLNRVKDVKVRSPFF